VGLIWLRVKTHTYWRHFQFYCSDFFVSDHYHSIELPHRHPWRSIRHYQRCLQLVPSIRLPICQGRQFLRQLVNLFRIALTTNTFTCLPRLTANQSSLAVVGLQLIGDAWCSLDVAIHPIDIIVYWSLSPSSTLQSVIVIATQHLRRCYTYQVLWHAIVAATRRVNTYGSVTIIIAIIDLVTFPWWLPPRIINNNC